MMEKTWRNFGIVFDTLSRPYFPEFFHVNVYCDDGEHLKNFQHRIWHVEPATFPWIFREILTNVYLGENGEHHDEVIKALDLK